MPSLAPASHDDRAAVVSKAVLRAAEALGLKSRRLAAILGTSEPTLSRMRAGSVTLEPSGKSYELAVLLIRIFRSLDAIAGGDAEVVRRWLESDNLALGGKPLDRLTSVTGLVDVLAYLDARRALV